MIILNLDAMLSFEYIDKRVSYMKDSNDYLVNILKSLISNSLLMPQSKIEILIDYFSPEMYTPLSRFNYLEFYNDNFYDKYSECKITIKIYYAIKIFISF